MIALFLLLALLATAALPNRWVVAALPLVWVLERLLPLDLQIVAHVGAISLSPADVIIALLIAKLVVSLVLRKELVLDRPLYLAFLAYLAVNLIATFAAGMKWGEPALIRSLTSWARFISEALVVVVIAQSVRTLPQAKLCLRILLGTLVLLALVQFVNLFGAGHGITIGEVQGLERGEVRYFGPIGDSVGMVLLLGYLVALCFASVTGAALFLGGILLTAGLGATLAAGAATLLFLLFGTRTVAVREFARRRLWLLPLLAGAALFALALFGRSQGTTLLDRLTSGNYIESGAQRGASIKLAGAMIMDNPLLGVGYMGYEQALARYGGDTYFDLQHPDGGTANANNQILQALTNSGILGLLAFAALIFCAARLFLRVANYSDDLFISSFYLAAFLWLITQVVGNVAAVWLNPGSFVARLLWVSLGTAVAITRLLPATKPEALRPEDAHSHSEFLPA